MPIPAYSLVIDGGAPTTNDLFVDLTINASGTPTHMRFSNGGVHWSALEPYAATKINWDLRSYGGNDNVGNHTIICELQDQGDATTVCTSASIDYRHAVPSVKIYPMPAQVEGTYLVNVQYILYAPFGVKCNIQKIEFSHDGLFTPPVPLTPAVSHPDHDGTSELDAAPNGIPHNYVWVANIDFPGDVSDISQIRMQVVYANEHSEVALSQQFKLDTREEIEIADLRFTRGDAARIKLLLLDKEGQPYDASNLSVTSLKNPEGTEQLLTPIIATRDSLGYYHVDWTVPNNALIGLWTSKWDIDADHVQSTETVYFSIVEEVTPYIPLRQNTCVVYGQLVRADESPYANIDVHFLPHHISDVQWFNPTTISTDPVITITDDDGRFKVELIKNTELIIYIPKLSFRQFAKVPNLNTSEFRAMMTLLPIPPRDQFGNRA
jgi:hypothetical protein